MLLPTDAWFEPVLIAAIIVFVVDVIGNMIVFSRRPVLNALASAIVFGNHLWGSRLLRLRPGGDVGFDYARADRTGSERSSFTSTSCTRTTPPVRESVSARCGPAKVQGSRAWSSAVAGAAAVPYVE